MSTVIKLKTAMVCISILVLGVSIQAETAAACTVPSPVAGMVKTNVGKNSWTQDKSDDWQHSKYEETRGSLSGNNYAHAWADAVEGRVKLKVRRDSSNPTDFSNVWHGYEKSWASGAVYDSFSFSPSSDIGSVFVNISYGGTMTGDSNSLAGFDIILWGDGGQSTLSLSDSGSLAYDDLFSVPLLDIATQNAQGEYNLGFEIFLFAEGGSMEADFGNSFSLSFSSDSSLVSDAWTVSGRSFTESAIVDVSSVPLPPSLWMMAGGLIGLARFKRRTS